MAMCSARPPRRGEKYRNSKIRSDSQNSAAPAANSAVPVPGAARASAALWPAIRLTAKQ